MYTQEQITGILLLQLATHREQLTEQWNHPKGTTTRHFVLDQLLPSDLATLIYDSFPKSGDGFYTMDSFREKKKTSKSLDDYEPILGAITYAFQDPRVVKAVSAITGFAKLDPDPLLYAGGLSMMFKDDFLNPHIDNSHDSKRQSYRRLNLLYYASPDWSLENGGNFELWDETRTVPKTIVSTANRLVVMETNKFSWHSVSKVNVDLPRCCVSNYYFSQISPDNTEYFHVTSFTGRPNEKMKGLLGGVDNLLRNFVSRFLKRGRGLDEVNKSKK